MNPRRLHRWAWALGLFLALAAGCGPSDQGSAKKFVDRNFAVAFGHWDPQDLLPLMDGDLRQDGGREVESLNAQLKAMKSRMGDLKRYGECEVRGKEVVLQGSAPTVSCRVTGLYEKGEFQMALVLVLRPGGWRFAGFHPIAP